MGRDQPARASAVQAQRSRPEHWQDHGAAARRDEGRRLLDLLAGFWRLGPGRAYGARVLSVFLVRRRGLACAWRSVMWGARTGSVCKRCLRGSMLEEGSSSTEGQHGLCMRSMSSHALSIVVGDVMPPTAVVALCRRRRRLFPHLGCMARARVSEPSFLASLGETPRRRYLLALDTFDSRCEQYQIQCHTLLGNAKIGSWQAS